MNTEIIKRLVNKHDPLHLIKMGAPDDEYQLEIGRIAVVVENNSDIRAPELATAIKNIFITTFDEHSVISHGIEVYDELARDIVQQMRGNESTH
jgi:hypothetical protein